MHEGKTYVIELDGSEMLRTDDTAEAIKAYEAWSKIGTVRVFYVTVWDLTDTFEK